MERYCCCQRPENLPTLEAVADGAGDEEEGEVDVGGDDADGASPFNAKSESYEKSLT